jgi:ribose 5-phosphate isomerase A
MSLAEQKKQAALAAVDRIPSDAVIGVGTGSTTNCFIDALPGVKGRIKALVSSSKETTERLQSLGLPVDDPNQFSRVDLYVDGADEFDPHFQLIKGGGGAMTGERIIASMAKEFICIVDESKAVKCLGKFPVAVEVLQPARSAAARRILALGGDPVYREGFVSDWGNPILDVYNLKITDALALESELNQIPGVIGHGLFATCLPQIILQATKDGTKEFIR